MTLSDEFFGLFQDETRKGKSAYFTGPNVTLSEAQIADVDLNLDKLDLKPGMTPAGDRLRLGPDPAARHGEVRRQRSVFDAVEQPEGLLRPVAGRDEQRAHLRRPAGGLEQFHTLSTGSSPSACAWKRTSVSERYGRLLQELLDILLDDGRMTIQSSVSYHPMDMAARGKKLTSELARFARFIYTEIFGGRLPSTKMMVELGEGGFRCARDDVATQPLHQDPWDGRGAGAQQGCGHRHHR